jgi:hypothetical protein
LALYAVTQLQEAELTSPGIMGVIGAMNERYAKRLGFDPSTIENARRAEIEKVNATRAVSN